MTQHRRSATSPSRLDELLTRIGLTRQQLAQMTAEELFAAATRWQQTAWSTTVEVDHPASLLHRAVAYRPRPSADLSRLN